MREQGCSSESLTNRGRTRRVGQVRRLEQQLGRRGGGGIANSSPFPYTPSFGARGGNFRTTEEFSRLEAAIFRRGYVSTFNIKENRNKQSHGRTDGSILVSRDDYFRRPVSRQERIDPSPLIHGARMRRERSFGLDYDSAVQLNIVVLPGRLRKLQSR